jgi:hypothetical protein
MAGLAFVQETLAAKLNIRADVDGKFAPKFACPLAGHAMLLTDPRRAWVLRRQELRSNGEQHNIGSESAILCATPSTSDPFAAARQGVAGQNSNKVGVTWLPCLRVDMVCRIVKTAIRWQIARLNHPIASGCE